MLSRVLGATFCGLLFVGCGGDSDAETVSRDRIEAERKDAAEGARQRARIKELERQVKADRKADEQETRSNAETEGTAEAGAQGSLGAASARVGEEGYEVIDSEGYDPSRQLRVLIGVRSDSADGYAKRAFFFLGSDYLGTDTSEDSLGIAYASGDDLSATLVYDLYNQDDAFCCPTAGEAPVTFRWDGDSLLPGQIPPRAFQGVPGR